MSETCMKPFAQQETKIYNLSCCSVALAYLEIQSSENDQFNWLRHLPQQRGRVKINLTRSIESAYSHTSRVYPFRQYFPKSGLRWFYEKLQNKKCGGVLIRRFIQWDIPNQFAIRPSVDVAGFDELCIYLSLYFLGPNSQ
jgi:hypothetical protein